MLFLLCRSASALLRPLSPHLGHSRTAAFLVGRPPRTVLVHKEQYVARAWHVRCGSTTTTTAASSASVGSTNRTSAAAAAAATPHEESSPVPDPWSHPRVEEAVKSRKRRKTNKARFRQHVNPLARHYQQPCALPDNWPQSVFKDAELPLHVDIGCGKGGFLMELAAAAPKEESESDAGFYRGRLRNYLGLEIRPLVAQHALEKLAMLRQQQMQQQQHSSSDNDSWTDRVHFVGCNVNVDLDRILGLYGGDPTTSSSNMTPLEMVTLQFPDPHFKSYHAKRRVVNADLVRVLARHLAPGTGQVFLQSDVQSVLDDMRQQFAAHPAYFADQGVGHSDGYYPHNVFDIPTEREVSVLEKGLPVYRALFVRTAVPCESMDPADPEEQ